MLQPRAGILFVVRQIEDQASVHILEYGVPFGASELVDGVDRSLDVVGAERAPGRQQRAGEVVDGPMHGLTEMRAGVLPLLLLERAHTENKMGIAVVAIELHKPLGKPHRFIDLALGQQRIKRLPEQSRITLPRPEPYPISTPPS